MSQPPQDPYGQQPPNQWGQQPQPPNQWGQQPQPNNEWGQNQYGQQQQPNQWGQQPQQQTPWNQQQPFGMPGYQEPKRSGGCLKWFLIGIAVLVLACGGLFYFGYSTLQKSLEEATPVLNTFMEAGVNQDVDAALAVSVPAMEASALENLFSNREYFEGYRSIKTDITKGFDFNMSSGEGTQMTANGTISYDDGRTVPFVSTMVKRGNRWLIQRIVLDPK